jgi:hypothetical protein
MPNEQTCRSCRAVTDAADRLCPSCFDGWEAWEAKRQGLALDEFFWQGDAPPESIRAWLASIRFAPLRAALAYLTDEWLAEGQFDPDAEAPTAREIRACRASQMRDESFDAFNLQGGV